MSYILTFIIVFLVVLAIYHLFVIRKDVALDKMKKNKEVLLFCKLNKIDVNKYDIKKIVKSLSFGNAFIIALMTVIVFVINELITNLYLWLIVSAITSIIILIPTILLVYKFIGKKLRKEGI